MRRVAAVLLVLMVAACGGDGTSGDGTIDTRDPTTVGETAWMEQFEPFTSTTVIDGQQVGVMEDEGTIYVQDCALAEELTGEGGVFGPSPRDPVSGDFEPGYGSVCE